jgi:3-oxoacyl-[acyl-carrier protein] reductase
VDRKIALVTGSARGIGHSIIRVLIHNGYLPIVSDIAEESNANGFLDDIKELTSEFGYIKCDISNQADRVGLFETIFQKYGRLDVLVNNAGVAPLKRLDILETTSESFDRVLGINLKGTFFMCQAAASLMIRVRKSGLADYAPRIVNISSMSAYTSSVSRGEYCISKAGISMVTKLFADRLAEYHIPVFEVRPGIILTDMTAVVKEKYEKMIEEGVTPIKRFGQPEDVANAVAAACSGLLDFTTGQVLNADGGFHLRRL